jgi:hypothetical protein
MKASEIIAQARDLLSDTRQPFLWSESEMIQYLNSSINEAAEKAKLFLDSLTPAVCQITVQAADPLPDYPLDMRVLEVKSARLNTQSLHLNRKTKDWMDKWFPQWRSASPGDPRYYLTDYSEGYLTLHPKSSADATLHLTVYRLPLVQFTETNLDDEPEINFRHHFRLIDGILAQAYNKEDSDTLDPEKAGRHLKLWLNHINEMSRGRIRLHEAGEFLGPHYGAI